MGMWKLLRVNQGGQGFSLLISFRALFLFSMLVLLPVLSACNMVETPSSGEDLVNARWQSLPASGN